MAKVLELYPLITDTAVQELNCTSNFKIYYSSNGVEKEIPITNVPDTECGYYIDDNGEWNPSNNNMYFDGKISISNLNILYNTYKVAEDTTTLGIGMTFVSKTSKFNFSKSLCEFNLGDDYLNIPFGFNIEKNRLGQNIEIEFFVYVKQVENTNSLFCSIEGSNLGVIHTITIDVEGSGSIFPIKIIDDPSKPLWTMSLNYDTLDDNFSMQTVCIKINKSHKDYKFLGSEDIDSSNYYLWKEILANFFVNILLNSSSDYDTLADNLYQDGTVGCFISYIILSFGIDKYIIDNPIMLFEKIRLVLDKIIK